MKIFAWLAAVGALVAATSTMGCWSFLLDESEMPESLL